MKALDILKEELIDNFISHYSVGDTWRLCFGNCWLICQNVISKDEEFLTRLIQDNYKIAKESVDKNYISKSIVITSNMRILVTGLELDNKSNLTIEFENGSNIIIPSNEEIVDWQWCLNESGNDPYRDYLVACFWEGEIKLNADTA
ncbi:MAG: hypothetical protein KTR26_17490 [Flammeovirgaceae bacterium]|nr:hypothetical protein [Flammeovirgaceae bacterium]